MLPPWLDTVVFAFWVRLPVVMTKIGEALLTVMLPNVISPPVRVTGPLDVIAPFTVTKWLPLLAMVPPKSPMLKSRLLSMTKPGDACPAMASIPPLIVMLVVAAGLGTAPRLASLLICKVPPLMKVPPR